MQRRRAVVRHDGHDGASDAKKPTARLGTRDDASSRSEMTTPKMTTPEMAVHQQDATLAAWVMMVVAAFAPAAAVMLVVHGSLVTAVAALGTAVVALVAVFLLLPFDQMAQVCERLGQ